MNLKMKNKNYDSYMVCSDISLYEKEWWLTNLRMLNGNPIKSRPVDFLDKTYASLHRWGARFEKNDWRQMDTWRRSC